MGIKNIVFDVGKVLVDFDWQGYLDSLELAPETCAKVADATVRSDMWREFDRGRIPEEEILAHFIEAAPDCEQEIRMFWDNVGKCIKRYAYAVDWIRELQEKGCQVYLLSNYPNRIYQQSREALAFVDIVEGGVFSYQVKTIKPEPEIYQILFEKYGLKAEECVFLDDNLGNVEAAEKLGMKAIYFHSKAQAEVELEELGVK